MASLEHLAILKKGVPEWNRWRSEQGVDVTSSLSKADLAGADLSGANLMHANLSDADLTAANLSGASLIGADLYHANLSGPNLSHASLTGADLLFADLSGANLTGAKLRKAKLREARMFRTNLGGADLSGAELAEAMFGSTILVDLNLVAANGLDQVAHQGPSFIGIDTIYRSKGKIPESFVRGAGVPDNFVGYMHSLADAGSSATSAASFEIASKYVRALIAATSGSARTSHGPCYRAVRAPLRGRLFCLPRSSLLPAWNPENRPAEERGMKTPMRRAGLLHARAM